MSSKHMLPMPQQLGNQDPKWKHQGINAEAQLSPQLRFVVFGMIISTLRKPDKRANSIMVCCSLTSLSTLASGRLTAGQRLLLVAISALHQSQ